MEMKSTSKLLATALISMPLTIMGASAVHAQTPPSPSILDFTEKTYNSISIHWQKGSLNEKNFTVERSQDQVNWTVVGSIRDHRTSGRLTGLFQDRNLLPEQQYCYRFIARSAAGINSLPSAAKCATTTAAEGFIPNRPLFFRVTERVPEKNPESVTLSWQDNSTTETSFVLEKFNRDKKQNLNDDNIPWEKIHEINYSQMAGIDPKETGRVFTFTDRPDNPFVNTCYRVRAVNAIGEAFTRTCTWIPAQPTDLVVKENEPQRLVLQWRDVEGRGYPFSIRQTGSGQRDIHVPALAARPTRPRYPKNRTSVLTDLNPDTRYCFKVRTGSRRGLTLFSNEVCVRTAQEPVEDKTITKGVYLQAQPIVQGNRPYVANWPPAGIIRGPLEKLQLSRVQTNLAAVHFVKQGHSTNDCQNSNAVVTLRPGQTMTSQQMTDVFGSAQPRFPLGIVACITPSRQPAPSSVLVNLTYAP